MSKPVRVVIATTEGPAEILRLTPEDPDVRSVVCIGGKALPLPISKAYDAFVREPTGVIERAFGHSAFRMDVSVPIDDGLSWQLGAFAAHALLSAGRLARRDDAAERIVWLTGEVDRDHKVLPVAQVLLKLDHSRAFIAEKTASGASVTLFIPQDNAAEIGACWPERNGLDPARVRIVPVRDVAEVLRDIGFARGDIPSAMPRPLPEKQKPARGAGVFRSALLWGLNIAVAALLLAGAFAWAVLRSDLAEWDSFTKSGKFRALDAALTEAAASDCFSCRLAARGYEFWLARQVPDEGSISITISEVRGRDGAACPPAAAALRTDYAILPVSPGGGGKLSASRAEGLCGLEFTLSNVGEPAHLWPFAQNIETREYLISRPRALEAGANPRETSLSFAVAMPEMSGAALPYQLNVLASRWPVAEAAEWAMEEMRKNPQAIYAAEWDSLREKLRRRGIALLRQGHEITP